MKRFIISLIILITIISASFSLPCYLKKSTVNLINTLDSISSDIKNNNIPNASSKTTAFINLWEKQKNIITIFVNHNYVDDVTYSADRLPSLLKYNDKSEFCSELNYIKSIINSIYQDDLPSFNNIF